MNQIPTERRRPPGPPPGPPPLMVDSRTGPMPTRAYALFFGIGSVLLGLTVAVLLAQGQVRAVVLILLILTGMLCLSPKRGVFILLTFLPFMYLIRRQVLHFEVFSTRDPILLFPPVVTAVLFLGLAVFQSQRLFHYLQRSALLKAILALLILFTAQMFNPLQGSLLVGLAGSIYFITPMLWVAFGLLLDERDMKGIVTLILILGAITALYGVYQHFFGLSEVERYELESKNFFKSFGDEARVMSTFAGLGDFSLYLVTLGALAFARYWTSKGNPIYLALLGLAGFGLLWTASRTSVLLLLFACVTFMIVNPAKPRQVLVRGMAALVIIGGLYAYVYSHSSEEIYDAHGSSNPFVAHVVGGVARPTDESTFQKRLRAWTYVMGPGLLEQPVGRGLGSTTTAAMKFTGGRRFEADSYFFEIVYGSSLAAGVLFVVIVFQFMKRTLDLTFRFPQSTSFRILTAVMAAYILGTVFGATVRDTISGPFAWLLIGWVARESVDRQEEGLAGEPAGKV